jgi:FtsH-binding integral membrane protein
MIQRKQTIWLLLASLTAFLLTIIPLYAATLSGEAIRKFMATESLLLFVVAVVTALIGFISIFLFKNRSLQLKMSVVGLLLSLGFIALEVWKIDEFRQNNLSLKGTYYWGALLPFLVALFYFLAAKYIRKDEKLLKSLNRLR